MTISILLNLRVIQMSDHIEQVSPEEYEKRNQEYEDGMNKAYRRAGRDIKIGIKEELIKKCEECVSTMILLKYIGPDEIVTIDTVNRKIRSLKIRLKSYENKWVSTKTLLKTCGYNENTLFNETYLQYFNFIQKIPSPINKCYVSIIN